MTTTPRLVKPFTQVNTTDNGTQDFGQIVGLNSSDGGYVIIWTDASHVYSTGDAVIGQRFDAAGNKVGGEVRISQFANGDDSNSDGSSITRLPNGNIAVTYTDTFFGDSDTYVRVVNSSLGVVRDDPIVTNTSVQTRSSSITSFVDGSYVVSYTVDFGFDRDVVARIVSPTGSVGAPITVKDNGTSGADFSQLATLSNNTFVDVYQVLILGEWDIHFSIYTAAGVAVGSTDNPVFGAHDSVAETDADVAALVGGGFVVAWTDIAGDASGYGIRASIYDNAGNLLNGNIQINTTTESIQYEQTLVALPDGGFVATWNSPVSVNDDVVRGQRFDALGNKVGVEYVVKGGTSILDSPDSALLSDGRIAYATGDFNRFDFDNDVATSIWTTGLADGHVHDFSGDGKSDILWQNDNGALGVWQLNGNNVIATQGLGSLSADWHIADTGDFNGDGRNDILWHNDNGATSIWELYGGGVLATLPVGTLSPDWHIAFTGDFGGDGKSDILWRNDNGALGVWQLNGNNVIATQGLGTVSADWHIADTGDFNGDGNSDLLWRNDNGATSIWELYSGGVLATLPVGTLSADWHVARTGDFNGDGMSDILWRNDNGALGLWELNGNNVIATLGQGTVSNDWHIADTGDVNGDDTSDILWHNDNGATGVWEFHGGNVIASAQVGVLSTDWHIMT